MTGGNDEDDSNQLAPNLDLEGLLENPSGTSSTLIDLVDMGVLTPAIGSNEGNVPISSVGGTSSSVSLLYLCVKWLFLL